MLLVVPHVLSSVLQCMGLQGNVVLADTEATAGCSGIESVFTHCQEVP